MNTIARFQVPEEAYLFCSYLDSHEIEAHVFDEHVVQMVWYYSDAIGGVRVVVPEEEEERATALLAEYREAMRQPSEQETVVRAWPVTLVISLFAGIPMLIFGRKKV